MKMHIGGQWVDKSEKIEVLHPYDGSVVDTIPRGDAADVELGPGKPPNAAPKSWPV